MRKPFFTSIPVTMSQKLQKGKPPTDEYLLEAWKDVPDQLVKADLTRVNPNLELTQKDHPTGVKSRARIIALRGTDEV